MSASPRPGASWLGQNYDKLALAVVLVLLLASAGLLLTKTTEAQKSSVEDPSLQPGWTGRSTTPLDITPLTNLMALLTHPLQVTAQQRRMMVGELRVASIPDGAPIAYNATKDPFSGALQPSVDFDPDSDGDGITDKIETAAGLNPSDPSDANADMDADGYTNAEEIQMKTDLRDAKVYPDPIAKLRLIRTVVNPFRFRFLSVSKLPDGDRFQLNLRSLERTYFARIGDEVEGFKVILYDEKGPEGPVLTLQQGQTLIRLIQGQIIHQEARTAELIFLLDGTKFRRQVGDELKLKDLLYKVVDIKPERVVLRDERDGREAAVAPWSQEERNRLQSEPAAGNPENSAPPAANPGNQEFPF